MKTTLKQANDLLRKGQYEEALRLYEQIKKDDRELTHLVRFNIEFIEKHLKHWSKAQKSVTEVAQTSAEKKHTLEKPKDLDQYVFDKILESGLFDVEWYLSEYQEKQEINGNPLAHYLSHGVNQGLNPSQGFDTRYYIRRNPDVAAAGINPFVHYVLNGRAEWRQPVPPRIPPLPELLPDLDPQFAPLVGKTDIVIPVYNGMEYLPALFDSLKQGTFSPFRLIVVDDASPDERIWPYLQAAVQDFPGTVLLRNDQNRGFVGTVNRAVEYTSSHFALLNTDVEVPPYWLERLMAPILADPKVASVTPFTNAGTICSFPVFCQDNVILGGWAVAAIDRHFARLAAPSAIDIPTGVGFCMAINRQAVDEIGMFDEETFGRGYGEENDWCMRSAARGYAHRMATNLFVYHKHGGSFPGEVRQKLIEGNLRILCRRHPHYPALVEDFIQRDPAKRLRQFLLMVVAGNLAEQRPVLVIDHNLGGGANHYRSRLVDQYRAEGRPVLLFLDDFHDGKLRLVFAYKGHDVELELASMQDLRSLCRHLPLGEIFYNDAVSFADSLGLTALLLALHEDTGAAVTVAFHDFYPICPSYTLIGHEGRYCGLPDPSVCARCLPANPMDFLPETTDIGVWRAAWGKLLAKADTVLCFSDDTARIVRRVYPEVENKIVVHPHRVDYLPTKRPRLDFSHGLHIGVVGAINYQKGSEVVRQLAEIVAAHGLQVRLTVVGMINNVEKIPTSLEVTGIYDHDALPDILESRGINMCLFPSIWPETFSYVVSELILMGMPLCCFNLGAPADRVRSYSRGRVLGSMVPSEALAEITAFFEELREAETTVSYPLNPCSL